MSPTASHCPNNKPYVSIPIKGTAAKPDTLSDKVGGCNIYLATYHGGNHTEDPSESSLEIRSGTRFLLGQDNKQMVQAISRQQK